MLIIGIKLVLVSKVLLQNWLPNINLAGKVSDLIYRLCNRIVKCIGNWHVKNFKGILYLFV